MVVKKAHDREINGNKTWNIFWIIFWWLLIIISFIFMFTWNWKLDNSEKSDNYWRNSFYKNEITKETIENALSDLYWDVYKNVKWWNWESWPLSMTQMNKLRILYPEFNSLSDDVINDLVADMSNMIILWREWNYYNKDYLLSSYPEIQELLWEKTSNWSIFKWIFFIILWITLIIICIIKISNPSSRKSKWDDTKASNNKITEKMKEKKAVAKSWDSTKIKSNIATRWARFWAWFFDIFFSLTIIWGIINLIMSMTQWTTVWLKVAWISIISTNSKELTTKQKILRFLSYVPTRYAIIAVIIIPAMIFWIDDNLIELVIYPLMWTIFLLNIIELFFKSPTFIDKWLDIVKIKYKWISTRAIVLIFIVAMALWKIAMISQWL